jgi:hypothetical protein
MVMTLSASLSLYVRTGQAALREGSGSDAGNQPWSGTALGAGVAPGSRRDELCCPEMLSKTLLFPECAEFS